MNYQKDIKNTDQNSYGHSNLPSNKLLVNKEIFEYSYKKTEKLVTALYMVTDCMEVDDALKGKVRSLSIELLSYIHKLSHTESSPVDNRVHVATCLMNIDEILSLIGIANTIGFISEMNTSILNKELTLLGGELRGSLKKDDHFTFTLDEKMFDLPAQAGLPRRVETSSNKSFSLIKDMSAHAGKRTEYNMSFRKDNSLSLTKAPSNPNSSLISKKDRIDKILNIIKDKKGLPGNETGVSIKDISTAFTDCSEKTIQRELNSLVSKGLIKKTGAKRWSRYQAL